MNLEIGIGDKKRPITHGIVHAGFSGFRGFWLVKKVGVN
jgi:hypothetical protein